jgi:hypothetical protein
MRPKHPLRPVLKADDVALVTDLIGFLRVAGDRQLDELLDRLRERANELEVELRADPGNGALAVELAWILCVNHEVARRRRIFEAFEAQFETAS